MNIDLTNFHKISPEKQKTVINAGFRCFGENGYKKTSVADIAEAAGISKASLFQYFGTKKNMYLFLYDFAGKETANRAEEGTDDYFECAEKYIRSLAEVSHEYPNLFDFLVLQTQRTDYAEVEALPEVADAVCQLNVDLLYAKVDWSRFKDGFDADTVQNMFNWLTSGCIAQLSATMPQEQVYNEIFRYLRLLKSALYRTEFLGGE
ncbi:MAG: TetR/AcrR family transcriptional regulator [Bacillota bacterium]|nr:TetR/AcrR family transcriptional regulator [Bacillota bacterium]